MPISAACLSHSVLSSALKTCLSDLRACLQYNAQRCCLQPTLPLDSLICCRLSAFFFARTGSDVPMDLSIPTIFLLLVYFIGGVSGPLMGQFTSQDVSPLPGGVHVHATLPASAPALIQLA